MRNHFGTVKVGLGLMNYTLKNIPEDLYNRLTAAANEEFRSLNQEILARLSRSFDAQDAKMAALHARWVREALASGDPAPLARGELEAAFERGRARAKARKSKAA